jgi:hypothetical protein
MVSRISNVLLDFTALCCPVIASTTYWAIIVNLQTRDVSHGPCCELTVPVFAENIGMYVVDIDPTMFAEKMSETSAVENSSRPDHSPPIVPGTL